MNPIRLKGVSKFYGSTKALKNIDLTIEPNVFHFIGGPNGSGKTTLFKLILGLTPLSEGKISIPKAKFGCSYQMPKVYKELSVRENLKIFSEMGGERESEWIRDVENIFDLDKIMNKKSSDISAGNTKKLDLVLSLIKKPDYLILDEPLASLDRESSLRLLEFLEKKKTIKGTIVLSHQLAPFTSLIERLSILREGEVVLDKSREELEKGEYGDFQELYEKVCS